MSQYDTKLYSCEFKFPSKKKIANGRQSRAFLKSLNENNFSLRSNNIVNGSKEAKFLNQGEVNLMSRHRTRNKFIIARHHLSRLLSLEGSMKATTVSKTTSVVRENAAHT